MLGRYRRSIPWRAPALCGLAIVICAGTTCLAARPASASPASSVAKARALLEERKAEKAARVGRRRALPVRRDRGAQEADLDDWRGERLAEIRALIHEVDPEVVEEWKWMGSPVWSHDGMYAVANAHKSKVKLTFFHGAHLPDPEKLFNAGLEGNKWRAIDLHEGDAIDRDALAALLRAAVKYNTTHSVPKSRGSRA